MSTIAVTKSRYAVRENNAKKGSLKERLRKYFVDNAETLTAGLLFMRASAKTYHLDLYKK